LAASANGAAALAALGGGSPYLSDLVLREAEVLLLVLQAGPAAATAQAMDALAAVPFTAPRAQVAAALRQAKRQVALAAGIADVGRLWGQAAVTAALSDLAERALRLAVAHLMRAAHDAGEIALPDPADPVRGCGLTVLGMGKLGARELNYSSDIDLVLLYDPDAQPGRGDTLGAVFTRAARALVAIMEARDANGYVFRTDLRLRPDPAATPPAVALPAAIAYYESMGQNWERAAMIKARPVAGDLAVGAGFLQAIRPFVWRRGLDFAAIADIQAMKRRINDHKGLGNLTADLAGFDLKLGQGGIREIEFAAQTLQLVWGGRDPGLRDPATLGALRRLVRAGHLPRRACAELTVAYRVLRRAEHRLQMVNDRQTHALPAKAPEMERFAAFMGCADAAALQAHLLRHLSRVAERYAAVFDAVPDLPGDPHAGSGLLDLSGMDDPPETVAALGRMGFRNHAGMIATLRGWHTGRLRALRSARSRELLDGVLPAMLRALSAQADPDAAFARLDALLSRLPAGVPLLSMIQRNPALLGRIAAVLGAAPSLADHLARVPAALEGLLHPDDAMPDAPMPDARRLLSGRLGDASSLEDVLAIIRHEVRAEEFRLCVAQMEGWLDVDQAGLARTALADAALSLLLPAVLAGHRERYGTLRGGDMAVVLLGKAGSREMMAGSDLDLMLVYAHPPDVTESAGRRPVPSSQWFIRAAHAYVAALTAPGMEGPLYDVDMRLRPSGNKGPVAVSLAAFRQYHARDAWTWERMALTRARVVAGGPAIRARVEAAVAEALAAPRDPVATLADAAAMRGRLLRDLPPTGPWDTKLRPGGGIEVEFIAQTLQLVHGVRPGCQATRTALHALAGAGALPSADAAMLTAADRLWRTVQSMVRITAGRGAVELPGPAAEALLRVAHAGLDLTALRATMDATAAQVRGAFVRHIGVPE
jgi:glutamate-ammonia-ligase adenylyltransferase